MGRMSLDQKVHISKTGMIFVYIYIIRLSYILINKIYELANLQLLKASFTDSPILIILGLLILAISGYVILLIVKFIHPDEFLYGLNIGFLVAEPFLNIFMIVLSNSYLNNLIPPHSSPLPVIKTTDFIYTAAGFLIINLPFIIYFSRRSFLFTACDNSPAGVKAFSQLVLWCWKEKLLKKGLTGYVAQLELLCATEEETVKTDIEISRFQNREFKTIKPE